MNILHLTHGIYDHRGVETFIKSLTNNLKDKCNQYLVVPEGRYKDIGFSFNKVFEIKKLNELIKIVEENNIDIVQIHWTGEENFYKDDLIKYKDSVFVINGDDSPESNMYCYLNIFTLWNPYIWEDDKKLPNPKRPKIIITTHTCSPLPLYLSKPCVDVITHVSNKVKDINSKIFTEHRVIYPGVDHTVFYRDRVIENSKFTIGYSGTMTKYNAEVFEAIKELTDMDFLFFGDGDFKNVPHHLKFQGKKNNIHEELKKLDMFLYPSNLDSLSISVQEAMATGLPILASDVVNEVVGDSGFIYHSIEDLITKLYLLKKSPKLRDIMGKKARMRVLDNFTLDIFIKEYYDLYRSLL